MEETFVSPVYNVMRIPLDKIQCNTYNPNRMSPVEFQLLQRSIFEDGYTMPIVCYYDKKNNIYEIVDGFHRYLVMKECKEIAERENYFLSVSVINQPFENRICEYN